MSKYRAQKTDVDGIRFASKREAEYYLQLKALQRAGAIRDLELQPRFTLQPSFKNRLGKTERAIVYVADFRHWDVKKKCEVVTDVKGFQTVVYRMKRKMLLYRYPDLVFEEAQ